jgi:hypothetical protein
MKQGKPKTSKTSGSIHFYYLNGFAGVNIKTILLLTNNIVLLFNNNKGHNCLFIRVVLKNKIGGSYSSLPFKVEAGTHSWLSLFLSKHKGSDLFERWDPLFLFFNKIRKIASYVSLLRIDLVGCGKRQRTRVNCSTNRMLKSYFHCNDDLKC